MTGSGGLGSMPSSRLTRLLQEKAEALRKARQAADSAGEVAETRIRLLAEVGVELPETAARQERIRENQRKSDWGAAESESLALTAYIDGAAPAALLARREELLGRAEALRAAGGAIPPELETLIPKVRELTFRTELTDEVATVGRLLALIRQAQGELAETARQHVLSVARWVGVPEEELAEIERKTREILPAVDAPPSSEWIERLQIAIPQLIPSATAHRDQSRAEAEALIALGRDLGVPMVALEEALGRDTHSSPTQWGETVPEIERRTTEMLGELRGRVSQVLSYLVTTLASLPEHGADTTEASAAIERIRAQVDPAGPLELPALLQEARTTAEDPIVAVVAGLLDEVRPKLVEARELGRDPSEVFSSMNRAREALRLKIYSEALAASVEAIDRVSQLTSDLDSAREEAEALGRLLDRLEGLKVAVGPFRSTLGDVGRSLDKFEVDQGRATLREAVRSLGRETARYFGAELERLSRASEVARQRGFLPTEVPDELERARRSLDVGALPEAGEILAEADVRLRTAMGPYLARRVDEMRRGFDEVRERDLSTATLRSLADADVALRVKEDASQSLESLRQAEREFSAAFAAESSSLLEDLEERERVLEEMGGAGSEFLRQTDEIQQIFDMGDFVRCARSAREFLESTEGVQRSRAEQTLSFAKLDLVELEKLGVTKEGFSKRFEGGHQDLAEGRLVEAYRAGSAVHAEAGRILASARDFSSRLALAKERLLRLEQGGSDTAEFQQGIEEAGRAFRAADFEAMGSQLGRLEERLDRAAQALEAQRTLSECDQMIADATRLGIPVDDVEAKVREARGEAGPAPTPESFALALEAHEGLVRTLRPVLEENLKSVEDDFEVARRSGVELGPLAGILAEARRRVAFPVPLGVADRIESARAQLSQTRGLVEHAERGVKRVQEALGQAELLGLVTPAIRGRVEALERSLKDRQFARAVDASGPLEQEILRANSQHITRTIAGLQGLLVRAREDGTPTAAAENMLARAREALQAGRPMEALQLAAQSEGEVERSGLQSRLAHGALEAINGKLSRFDAEGIHFPPATALAAEIQTALEKAEFPHVLELAIEATDVLAQARDLHRKAREALELAQGPVGQARSIGAESEEVAAALDRARGAFDSGDYPAAAAKAREALDLASWAIERRFAGAIAEVQTLMTTAQSRGLPDAASVTASLHEAETLLQAKEWGKAGETLSKARAKAFEALDQVIASRRAEIAVTQAALPTPDSEESERRTRWAAAVDDARSRGAYADALAQLDAEEARGRESERATLEGKVAELKERLWVGERLGLDTTPAMERFSEAQISLNAGQLEAVERQVRDGTTALEGLIREGITRRLKQVETELYYARDGLRIRIGDLDERVGSVGPMVESGRLVEAGRTVLAVEEDLNQRKALHGQLKNLHYLIEAALRRAQASRLETSEARRLYEASVREAAEDYAGAIAKARSALKLVEGLLRASEPPTAFWPFKRPPG
jgi:hypothetical protein